MKKKNLEILHQIKTLHILVPLYDNNHHLQTISFFFLWGGEGGGSSYRAHLTGAWPNVFEEGEEEGIEEGDEEGTYFLPSQFEDWVL